MHPKNLIRTGFHSRAATLLQKYHRPEVAGELLAASGVHDICVHATYVPLTTEDGAVQPAYQWGTFETEEGLAERMERALKSLAGRYSDETILALSHMEAHALMDTHGCSGRERLRNRLATQPCTSLCEARTSGRRLLRLIRAISLVVFLVRAACLESI